MDKELGPIIKALKNIKLKEDEKVVMRSQIMDRFSSLSTQDVINPKNNRLYCYYRDIKNYYFLLSKNKLIPAFAIILIVVLAGGTSAFAERAVPGDLLYGIKVSINEKAAGIFALSKISKTRWKERLVERRLAEARELVSKDDLDESRRVGIENKIKGQINEFDVSLSELAEGEEDESVNSSDLNIRLQASLLAHQNIFEKLSRKDERSSDGNISDGTKNETEKLASSIKESKDKVKRDHKNLEKKSEQGTASNLLDAIKILYQKERANLSANIKNQIADKLALAEETLKEGRALLDSSDYANAALKFQSVIDGANEAKLLMLSNVIKSDLEDDMGIDEEGDDIEEHEFDTSN